MELLILLVFVLIIIVASGIVSGSEAALLSVSYAKAKEIADKSKSKVKAKKAELLVHVKENLHKYITTIVVLNNVVNIVGSIYVGIFAATVFGEVYVGLFSAVLTFLIIMFSEIIPKIYGEKHSFKISMIVVGPLVFLTKIFTPINFVLDKISAFFVPSESSTNVSEGEIKVMAAMGWEEGSINKYESDVIENVFRMNDTEVYDIMIPKSKVAIIDKKSSFDDIVKLAEATGFTRFPVSKNDEIVGLINVKDLFKFHGKESKFSVSKILRPIAYVPEVMKVSDLEEKLKKERVHMAVIVNEHGDFVGVVTLEDVIEELLGEIEDEFDPEQDIGIEEVGNNKFHIVGTVDVQVLNERFDLDIDLTDDFTTLNGFLIHTLGKIPKVNDIVKIPRGSFRVIKCNKKKVLKVEFLLRVEDDND